jgi:hypothetical protein
MKLGTLVSKTPLPLGTHWWMLAVTVGLLGLVAAFVDLKPLNERARHRFTVPQEAVIDLEERPDLRIENPKTPAVSVEVKWADERSANDLLERLENQLVGQYLRAHTSHYAVYLVGLAKEREWNSPNGDRVIQFDELIELLTTRAHELTKQRKDVEEVAVFGIDFRQPD